MDRSQLMLSEQKIRPDHRDRWAIVYVRQSTVHQVQHHQESTQLQYGLVDQAYRLGWPRERIQIIDDDLGVSGASLEGRHGFQRLLSDVALNRVGLILGIEMSRLARSCKDWYQLLELCAMFRTLIADLDGLYDPINYNDRLLLGLKGTMSEAELHILKQRMLRGALQKARRGDLVSKVPIGYIRDTAGTVCRDPDEQAQAIVRLIFEQFARHGSVGGVLRWLVQHQFKLPIRIDSGPEKGELTWRRPILATLRSMLTHPMYAGAYSYGRTCQNPTTRRVRGVTQRVPQDQWQVLLHDRHPAYITWEEFEHNLAQIQENRSQSQRRGSVRQGRALLAGLVVCGHCGRRMMTRYQGKASQPRYVCDSRRANYGDPRCQSASAIVIDEEVVRLALLALQPAALEVSLRVAHDVEHQRSQLETHWCQRLERATFDVDRARRQFDLVEPENRLVARSLELTWEEKLRVLNQLEQEHEKFQRGQALRLTRDEQERILHLAEDLPSLWNAPSTTDEDRKVILRQIIDRVVINVEGKSEWVEIRVHWVGDRQTYRRIRRPVAGTSQLHQWDQLTERLRTLKSAGLSSRQIAVQLQDEGFRPAKGKAITPEIVRNWISRQRLTQTNKMTQPSLRSDEWTIPDLLDRFKLPSSTVHSWIRRGEVKARQIGGHGGRWIIQASTQELQRLINRRNQRSPADQHGDVLSTDAECNCVNGGVDRMSAR